MRANYIHLMQPISEVMLEDVKGDFAELGVWRATTFIPMAELCRQNGITIHGVDSFEGMEQETRHDGNQFKKGSLKVEWGAENFRILTKPFKNVIPHIGRVPEILDELKDVKFAFVHLDLDQYLPTKQALEFLWPRMSDGGIIACHDYFHGSDKLASKAISEFLTSKNMSLNGAGSSVVIQDYSHHIWFKK